MKNIIIVNTSGEFSCDCLEQIASGSNELIVNVDVGDVETAAVTIKVNGSTETLYSLTPNSENIIQFSSEIIPTGEGVTTIEYKDNFYDSPVILTFNFPENKVGEMVVKPINDLTYNVSYYKPNELDGIPIANETSLGIVKGGENVKIRENGTMYVNNEEFVVDDITNARIDEICNEESFGDDPDEAIVRPLTDEEINEICV